MKTLLATGLIASLTAIAGPASANPVPYADPQASGRITLCNRSLHPVTGGSIDTAPFVWRAVGASAAPPLYDGPGRTATLYAYQPRPSVPAGQWSGEMLTSSARYSNTAHPTAQATGGDVSLRDFLLGYPALVDGYVQLRLYLDAPQQGPYTAHYDTADIHISGTHWTLVDPGTSSCTTSKATSLETVVLPSSSLTPPSVAPSSSAGRSAAAPLIARNTSATGPAGVTSYPTDTAPTAASRRARSGSNALAWTALAAALVLATTAAFVRRRRRDPEHPSNRSAN